MIRFAALLVSLAVLGAVAIVLTGDPALVLDARAAGFVLGVPWLVALATRAPAELAAAVADAVAADSDDLPAERRARSAGVLRGLAGQSLAAGVLMLFGGALHYLGTAASAGGSVAPAALVGAFGGLLLAPVYGLVLAAFVYAPLAERLAVSVADA